MGWIASFYSSALGKKAVMAVTGLLLFGFVFIHMAGNLKLYLGQYADGPHAGQYAIDVYGEWLREVGSPLLPHGGALWIFRLVLLVAVVLHMHCAWALTQMSKDARPVPYQKAESVQMTLAARTIGWGGVTILVFFLYHLAHLTLGWVGPAFAVGRVHDNMVAGFSVWWIAGLYMLGNLALGLHLYHGLYSWFQSLGWTHRALDGARRAFALVFAVLVTAGNLSFPLAVLTGFVK